MTVTDDREELVDDFELRDVERNGVNHINGGPANGTNSLTRGKGNRKDGTLLAEDQLKEDEEEGDLEDGDEDPWALLEIDTSASKTWKEMSAKERLHRVFVTFLLKPLLVLVLLYFFICSLDVMSSSFRLLGGREAGEVLGENELLNNPVCGLMLGILATVLVQSSSTSTSIVVSIVSAGLLNVQQAIYIIMGANIGTSVTNTIVSLAQVGKKNEFRRAFGAATVHDMFNWLGVIVILPLEAITEFLYHVTSAIVDGMNIKSNKEAKVELLKKLTKPFTSRIVQIDSKVITRIAVSGADSTDNSLLKIWCKKEKIHSALNETMMVNSGDTTEIIPVTKVKEVGIEKCSHLFVNTSMSERAIGGILLLVSLVMLCICLIILVKILHSLMKGRIATIIRKTLNADFPGCLGFLTGYVAIAVGAGITFLVQSSSVFTSAMTPLVGIGVITLERMYPLTLGSNIGTTATGLLAAMASSEGYLREAIQIALCHLLFNITAIAMWYPIPAMRRVPVFLAKTLGNTTAEYRWFAIMYLICMFFLLPLVVFVLSIISVWLLAAVGVPTMILLSFVIVVNILQNKRPSVLPKKLRTWSFLPLFMRSLEPMDMVISRVFTNCGCRRRVSNLTRKVTGKKSRPLSAAVVSNGDGPFSSTTMPNGDRPLSAAALTNGDQPLSTAAVSNGDRPLSVTSASNGDGGWPLSTTAEVSNSDRPLSATAESNSNSPLTATAVPDGHRPVSAVVMSNGDCPESATTGSKDDQPITTTAATNGDHLVDNVTEI